VPEYRYTVTEYGVRKPWLIVTPLRRLTVELDNGEDFRAWASQAWPRPRFQADLEAELLPPWEGSGG
jgi:hypothetical protein